MNYGRHKMPKPLKDEDKWFGFTKRQIKFGVPTIFIIINIITVTSKLHIVVLGIIISIILAICVVGAYLFTVPDNKYLFGSELQIEQFLSRMIRKKLPWNKVIYTKNYDNGYEEW